MQCFEIIDQASISGTLAGDLGPRPGLKEANVIFWALFCLCIVTPAVVILGMQIKSGNLYFEKSPVDFVYFYGIGQIARTHAAIDVYDYSCNREVLNKIQPLQNGKYGPSPYPPFVSQFFRLLAGLSFKNAFLLWFAISLTLYVTGIVLALRVFLSRGSLVRSMILFSRCLRRRFYSIRWAMGDSLPSVSSLWSSRF